MDHFDLDTEGTWLRSTSYPTLVRLYDAWCEDTFNPKPYTIGVFISKQKSYIPVISSHAPKDFFFYLAWNETLSDFE